MQQKTGRGAARTVLLRTSLAIAAAALAAVALLVGLALAAEPGGKEDPLATISYVGRYAQFSRVECAARRSLRLGTGAELVIVDPVFEEIAVRELDPLRDTLMDLTLGTPVQLAVLTAGHHYVNASNHDIFVRPDEDIVLLLRGEWK
jgi:hypothetical protein